MKNLCLYVFLLLSTCAHGQVVLHESNYPGIVTGTDSIKQSTTYCFFPSLTPASGGMWDFTVLTDTTPVFFDYRVSAPGVGYADSNDYTFLGYGYKGNVLSDITFGGILHYGLKVDSASYNIGIVTASPFDSLFIPAQNITYSSPARRVAFPATMGSSWLSVYNYDFGFELSTAFPAYNHAPGIVRSHIIQQSIVVGWGQARINDLSGMPTAYLNVLQVQTMTIKQDSFFINNALMPGTLLSLFGLYQGKTDTTYTQDYLRQGEITPLISILSKNGTYTQPIRARKHVQRLQLFTDGIAIEDAGKAVVFPNPIMGKELWMGIASGNYDYTMVDAVGRIVQSGTFSATNNGATLTLPNSIINGCYYLHLTGISKKQTIPVQIFR